LKPPKTFPSLSIMSVIVFACPSHRPWKPLAPKASGVRLQRSTKRVRGTHRRSGCVPEPRRAERDASMGLGRPSPILPYLESRNCLSLFLNVCWSLVIACLCLWMSVWSVGVPSSWFSWAAIQGWQRLPKRYPREE
jgi:uncharacterized membrane protein YbhN (UPF0104 family)